MKKIILALSAIALMSTAANAQDKDAAKKAELLKESRAELVEQLKSMGLEEEKVTKFADCYLADLDKNLSYEELKTANNAKEGEELPAELQQKLMTLGQECSSILQ